MAGQQPDHPAPSSSSPAPPPPSAERRNVASVIKEFRVTSVVDRLRQHLNGTSKDVGPSVFYNLCLSLARGIDYSVANNEVPYNPGELPELLKQVCIQKSDCMSKAVCMVLLLSAKNACNYGWFSEKGAHELLTLTEEMARNFYGPTDIAIGSSDTILSASTIMTRFYPSFKFGQIFTSLDVKPGYGTYISDFHIPKDLSYSGTEKIRLLVAQTDNMETSACIISPQQVNFLVNGKAVERRTNCNMDTGPQLPSNVTAMLKYGTNLLQAVGQFDGPCIIIIAFMSVSNEHDHSSLLPYHPPNVIALYTGAITNLPELSNQTRIKLPVKGYSCKHLQCFDFSNFMGINLRRPSWRCPHCNRYVCYTDVRVDQTLAKILEEVAEDIAEVIISADGSWKAVMESNDELTESPEENISQEKNVNPEVVCTGPLVDLTEINDEMDITPVGGSGTDDRKLPTHIASNQDGQDLASPNYFQTLEAQFRNSSEGHAAVPMNSNARESEYRNNPALRPRNMPPRATPALSRTQAPVSVPRTMTPEATPALSRPQAPVSAPQRARAMANPSIAIAYQNRPSLPQTVQLPQQQKLARPPSPQPACPHRPSTGVFSNFSNAHLQQPLNQFPSPSSRIRPTVGQPSLHQRNIPPSIAQAVGNQAQRNKINIELDP